MEIIKKYFDNFSPKQLDQLTQLKVLYAEWNEKINLISRKDFDSLYEKHVLHSLSIVAIFNFTDGMKIIDIGTGGGFPGIPLAIFFPEVQFHLCDSIQKKIKVVDDIAKRLALDNVLAQCIRVEEIRQKNNYDFAVSRAVAPLGKLWQWAKPLLRRGNENEFANGLICLKGGDLHLEISESGTRPTLWEVSTLFDEDYFKEKYILYVPR